MRRNAMLKRLLRPLLAAAATAVLVATGVGMVATKATVPMAALPDIEASCQTENPYVVVDCYRGTLRSTFDAPFSPLAPSIEMVNDTPQNKYQFQVSNFRETGAVWGLAYSPDDKMLYAASYMKRQLPFG